MEKRIEDVEIRMVYLEQTVEELNQVVIKQQDQIDRLQVEMRRMTQQIDSGAEFVRAQSDEMPPPHY